MDVSPSVPNFHLRDPELCRRINAHNEAVRAIQDTLARADKDRDAAINESIEHPVGIAKKAVLIREERLRAAAQLRAAFGEKIELLDAVATSLNSELEKLDREQGVIEDALAARFAEVGVTVDSMPAAQTDRVAANLQFRNQFLLRSDEIRELMMARETIAGQIAMIPDMRRDAHSVREQLQSELLLAVRREFA